MLPSRGKALSLLRILNTFTRFLPRTPEDIAFKGRVWQFASRTIGITDRSAVNFRGEFNHYKTTWEQEPSAPATEADGDVSKAPSRSLVPCQTLPGISCPLTILRNLRFDTLVVHLDIPICLGGRRTRFLLPRRFVMTRN
jgi:hypothetical protein